MTNSTLHKTPFREWVHSNSVSDNLSWKSVSESQNALWFDLAYVVGKGLSDPLSCVYVIGTHWSKSVTLPVVQYDRSDMGLVLTLRDNFYNVKLSVDSVSPIGYSEELACLFHTKPPPCPEYTGDPLRPIYFEGFPPELVYGYYSDNPCKWSAELSQSRLKLVLFFILRSLGGVFGCLLRVVL